jgi:putative addiction module component (TIGR02574 family)
MNDFSDLFKLSVAERIHVEGLWDSIAADTENPPPLSEEQIAEIERRLAEHEKNPERARPWEEVRERLWAHCR